MKTILEVVRLRSGTEVVGPKDSCGTCGWHPKAWTLGVITKRGWYRQKPIDAFLEANPNWNREEVTQ